MSTINHRDGKPGGGWTLDTLQEHNQIVDTLKEKLDTERDRRYSEVNIEREKALKIKEEADKAALGLAREIQSYKDEKANQLREQISSERGTFATKDDLGAMMREIHASIQPLSTYVAGMAGKSQGHASGVAMIVTAVSIGYSIIATIGVVFALLRH
jgi:hypothetical protein